MKRIFTSFAIEDEKLKNLFVGQSKNENCPYEFADYSVKEPFDYKWKMQCEEKIKTCNGMIALISNNSQKAEGEKWEVEKALELRLPIIGVVISENTSAQYYSPYNKIKYIQWEQKEISRWIENL